MGNILLRIFTVERGGEEEGRERKGERIGEREGGRERGRRSEGEEERNLWIRGLNV